MDTPTITYVAAWATAATAGGTLALAGATYWLARKTRETADAAKNELVVAVKQGKAMTEQTGAIGKQTDAVIEQGQEMKRQGDVAEAALNASIRPLLINVPEGTTHTVNDLPGFFGSVEVDRGLVAAEIAEGRAGRLAVPVRNVGAGLALGVVAVAAFAQNPGRRVVARAAAPSVIAPGEHDSIYFADTAGAASAAAQSPLVTLLESKEDLVVEVVYTDVAGRQKAATTFHLTPDDVTVPNTYRVTAVEPGHEQRITPEALTA